MREIEPGRFRRVVASPRPIRILEEQAIARLVEAGVVTIACGGGGIPVAWEGDRLVGVEGVIDKDFAASLLARDLHAHKLIIVTDVEQAAIRFGRPGQQWLGVITLEQAREYLAAGEFPAGSMGPKIEAGIDFVAQGGGGVYHHFNRACRSRRTGRDRHSHRGVMIITNARILTFDSANRVLDSGSVEIRRRRQHRQCE